MSEIHPEVQKARRYGVRPVLHLVACGQEKLDEAAPAGQLYTGDLTRKAIGFASSRGGAFGEAAPVAILSARHGILDLDAETDPYEQRIDSMTPGELDDWRWMIVEQLADRDLLDATIFVHAGARYVSELRAALTFTEARVIPMLRGKQIGERKSWYKRAAITEAERAARPKRDYWWEAS